MEISAAGALSGLCIAIVLIAFRVVPVYGLIAGAFLGGLLGGGDPKSTVTLMLDGAQSIVPATIRIITAGILAGVLVESGAALKIAETIIVLFGKRYALAAIALATMFLTALGVFVDIAVITVAPIALSVAREAGYSRFVILLTMVGGGKSGNVISPNPNTIAIADEFHLELPQLMAANIIPALAGLAATVFIAGIIKRYTSSAVEPLTEAQDNSRLELPSLLTAVTAPAVTVLLLALRPLSLLFGINCSEIDPMIALPAGGIAGCMAMGKARHLAAYMTSGLNKMTGVAVLLLGTGTLAGIIKSSSLATVFQESLSQMGLPGFMLAPLAGIVMSAATASTTAGASVASQAFSKTLEQLGAAPLNAAAMIHTGATVLDHLPHGSFFYATAGAVGISFSERLRLIPFETLIGLILTAGSTVIYGVLRF